MESYTQEQAVRELVAAAIRGELNGDELGFLPALTALAPSLLPTATNVLNNAINRILPAPKQKTDPLALLTAWNAMQPKPAPAPVARAAAPAPAPVVRVAESSTPVIRMSAAPAAGSGGFADMLKNPMILIAIAAVVMFIFMKKGKR